MTYEPVKPSGADMGDSDMGSSGTIQKESGFRRFSDKLLYGACAATITLVGMVWSITWLQTEAKAIEAHDKIRTMDSTQKNHAERIIRLEVLQERNEQHLKSIDQKQSTMDGKLETVQTTLNQVLLELRKGK